MSREQDQKLIQLYEKVVKKEHLKVGDKLQYIGDNKILKGKKGTVTKVGVGQIKFMFDHLDKEKTLETPLIKSAWKKVNEEEINEMGMVIGAPISRRKEATPTQEGAMKDLAFDLFDEIKNHMMSVSEIAKKTRKIAPQVFKHLNNAIKEMQQAMSSLPIGESTKPVPINEFKVSLKGNKVPIGLWDFEYIPAKGKKDIQFLINSMKHRDPERIIKLKNSVVMDAYAGQHDSLIVSLVRLGFDGEVVEWDRKEKGVVVYQKEGK